MAGPMWRLRLEAALTLLDHLLLHADHLLSAWLDIRPLHRSLGEAAAWLGRTWRAHLHRAHVRRYGPGRGVIAVVTNRRSTTNTTNTEETRER